MLHDEEAGFPQDPPRLAQSLLNVDLAALKSLDTTWHRRERQIRLRAVPRPDAPGPPRCRPTTQHNASSAADSESDSEVERVVGLKLCCRAARARPSGDGKISYKEAVSGRRRG